MYVIAAQPIGSPEISRMSLLEGSVLGGQDLFIIGKNFTKGTKVLFQEYIEGKGVVWEEEAPLESEYFQQVMSRSARSRLLLIQIRFC